MDESSVETIQEPQAAKKKLKRQFFLSVIVIAFILMLVGQLVGLLLMDFIAGIIPNISGAVLFLFQYLSFIGIDILVIVYCLLAEKPSYRSFFPQKPLSISITSRFGISFFLNISSSLRLI